MCRLKEHMRTYKAESEKISVPYNMKVIGHIEHLPLTLGTIHVDCSAVVTGKCLYKLDTSSRQGAIKWPFYRPEITALPPRRKQWLRGALSNERKYTIAISEVG